MPLDGSVHAVNACAVNACAYVARNSQGVVSGIFLDGGVPFSEVAHMRGTPVVKAAPEDLALAITNLEEVPCISRRWCS